MDLALNQTRSDDNEKNSTHVRTCEELQPLLTQLQNELQALTVSRKEISQRIDAVKRTLNGLNTLFGVSTPEAEGPCLP